jgi:hypothetical protein
MTLGRSLEKRMVVMNHIVHHLEIILEITSLFLVTFPPLSLDDCYDEYVMEWVQVASIVDSSNL